MTSISKGDDPFTCWRTGFLWCTGFTCRLHTINSAPDSISFEISCNSQGSPNCRHFSVVSHFLFVQWCSFSSINTLLAHSTRHDVTGKGCKIILISWSETPAFVLKDSISSGRVPSCPYSMQVETTRLSWVWFAPNSISLEINLFHITIDTTWLSMVQTTEDDTIRCDDYSCSFFIWWFAKRLFVV